MSVTLTILTFPCIDNFFLLVCILRICVGLLLQVVDSLVPLAEMFQYVSTLRGMTKGRASYTMQLAKFDVVPTHIQNQLSAAKEEAVTA